MDVVAAPRAEFAVSNIFGYYTTTVVYTYSGASMWYHDTQSRAFHSNLPVVTLSLESLLASYSLFAKHLFSVLPLVVDSVPVASDAELPGGPMVKSKLSTKDSKISLRRTVA